MHCGRFYEGTKTFSISWSYHLRISSGLSKSRETEYLPNNQAWNLVMLPSDARFVSYNRAFKLKEEEKIEESYTLPSVCVHCGRFYEGTKTTSVSWSYHLRISSSLSKSGEIEYLQNNQAWNLVTIPSDARFASYNRAFRLKEEKNRSPSHFHPCVAYHGCLVQSSLWTTWQKMTFLQGEWWGPDLLFMILLVLYFILFDILDEFALFMYCTWCAYIIRLYIATYEILFNRRMTNWKWCIYHVIC